MKKNMDKVEKFKSTALLSLTALGVVYGDIGTSPLYAVKEIYHHLGDSARSHENVLGYISLVLWSLILVISIKYIAFVLRADNKKEGGVFALFALLNNYKGKSIAMVSFLLLLSVGFLFGDGMITPAISVISAIEGLSVITTKLDAFVIPITMAILIGLFMIQKNGTAKIGIFFGPIIVVWFLSLGVLGLSHIVQHPEILFALNPYHAAHFIATHSIKMMMLVLGSVILVITGGEALYADMGHFSKSSIRLSWFALVFPALILNYLGQGAFLLGDQSIIQGNVFYSMVPGWALIPMVILATFATIIASQALITGAFSLVTQGISLGYIPFLKVKHTHKEHGGQIYVPFINAILLAGCLFLVYQFKSSSNLAAAYGLAVSYVMFVTTLSVLFVAMNKWNWSKIKASLIFVPFLIIDVVFLIANSAKFFDGGYIPVAIGFLILIIMLIWNWGKSFTHLKYDKYSGKTVSELIVLKKKAKFQLPKVMAIMSPHSPTKPKHNVALLEQVAYERNGLSPKDLLFITVVNHDVPYIDKKNRFETIVFYESKIKGTIATIRLNYGFMENPNIERDLLDKEHLSHLLINPDFTQWTFYTSSERFYISSSTNLIKKIKIRAYELLHRNSKSADQYFGLGHKARTVIEVYPVQLN